jgi:hypothetical protein
MPKDDDMLNMEGEQPKKKDGKRTKLLALLLIIIMGCCAGGYYLFFMEEDIPLPPPQKQKPQPNKQGAATPGAKGGAAGKTSSKAAETELPPIDIPKFGNLGEVTQILGDIEMKKHQKELVKLDKEINELVSGKDKSDRPGGGQMHPQVPALPGAAQTPDHLATAKAEREARIAAARKDAEDRKAELARIKDNQTTLLSIQGVNGTLSATVMNGHGKVAVLSKGSEWNGGQVVGVSRQGIIVSKNGKDVPIRFQSQE